MAMIPTQRPEFPILSYNAKRNHSKRCVISASWTMTMDSKSPQIRKDKLSLETSTPKIPHLETSRSSSLRFDRLQPSDEENNWNKLEFGRFVAREVVLDEEYWTAAWLRAECHWEHRPNERYVDSLKRKYAEKEFNTLKNKCKGPHVQSACIVVVRKEDKHIKRTVIKSVVGTLDLSIRYLYRGETFPGERVKPPLFYSFDREGLSRYGYVSNLCVTKFARRQGIARNMLHFAIESARIDGVDQVFVHVNRNNGAAHELYQKMGFEIVEAASPQLLTEQTYLLCIKT